MVKSEELGNPLPLVFEFFYVCPKAENFRLPNLQSSPGGEGGGFLKIGRMTSVESKKEASPKKKKKKNRGGAKNIFAPPQKKKKVFFTASISPY